MLQLVQTTVVVQTLNHNSVSIHWVGRTTTLTKSGRTPQRRQVFISSKILASGKSRSQRQLKTRGSPERIAKQNLVNLGQKATVKNPLALLRHPSSNLQGPHLKAWFKAGQSASLGFTLILGGSIKPG